MSTERETYLGDGLYASWDGFAFTLRAPRIGGDHFVVLEPLVLDEFESFVKRTEQEIEEQRQRRERSTVAKGGTAALDESPMSRALVEAYISGLALTEVAIVGAGKRCRIETGGELAPGETIAHRYFFKPSHAELVLATIGQDGLSGKTAAALVDAIVRTAATLGASYVTLGELRKAAEVQVDEITARLRCANQAGGLKQVNAQYKAYRQAQIAKAEKAVPYSKFIEPFIMSTVKQVAATGRMV
jgi:hypothetical protein